MIAGRELSGVKLIVSLMALFGVGSGLDATALPPPASARDGAEAPRQAELRTLVARVAPEATIESERYFTVGDEARWVAIVKRIDNLARERRATQVRFAAADPGKILVEGWRSSDGRGVVAAMLPQPGGGTVAYYQVKFGSPG